MIGLNKDTMAKITTLAKTLPTNCLRVYGTVIGYKDNKLAITDGFGLLEVEAEIPGKGSIAKNLTFGEVNFPDWTHVISGSSGMTHLDIDFSELSKFCKYSTKATGLYLKIDQKPNGHEPAKLSLVTSPIASGDAFYLSLSTFKHYFELADKLGDGSPTAYYRSGKGNLVLIKYTNATMVLVPANLRDPQERS